MDWITILIAIGVALLGLAENNKKKQRKKQVDEARRIRKNVSNSGQAETGKARNIYNESPKEKGMTLDDFRRSFEKNFNPKEVITKNFPGMPEGVGSYAEGSTMEGPPPEINKKLKNKIKKQKIEIPVTVTVEDGGQKVSVKTESITVAKPMNNYSSGQTGVYTNVADYISQKNLTQMQQAFLWAEILGPPKAKQRKF